MSALKAILNDAISQKKTISFTYDGLDRVVEPHHYGILKGTEQLHAYQVHGESKSGDLPEWRNFKLKMIDRIALNDTSFETEISYNPGNSKYYKIIKKIV